MEIRLLCRDIALRLIKSDLIAVSYVPCHLKPFDRLVFNHAGFGRITKNSQVTGLHQFRNHLSLISSYFTSSCIFSAQIYSRILFNSFDRLRFSYIFCTDTSQPGMQSATFLLVVTGMRNFMANNPDTVIRFMRCKRGH